MRGLHGDLSSVRCLLDMHAGFRMTETNMAWAHPMMRESSMS